MSPSGCSDLHGVNPIKKKKQKKPETILCHKCFAYGQQAGQNLHDFVTELKRLSSKCEFDNLHDSLMKDMIICGTKDNSLHERLLHKCDPTLSKQLVQAMLLRKYVSMLQNSKISTYHQYR